MKVLILDLVLLAVAIQAQRNDYHPVVSYGVLKNVVGNGDATQEFILALDDDDDVAVVERKRCNGERFQRCIQRYADDLDMDEIPKESLVFVRKVKEIVEEQGVEGLKKVCRAGTNLKRCLGDQYDKCISEDYLKSIGVQEADAKVFITLSVQMTYQCTTGLDTLIKNWDCIERVQREHRQQFEQCQSDYMRKIQDDPSNICKYTQEMVNCMTTPFKQSCPPPVYGVICHSIQISITTTLPQCSIVCTKGAKDIKMLGDGRVDTMSSFLSRVLLENIPARQFMAFRRRSWPMAPSPCDDNRFKRCINQFAKDVGLSALPKRAGALASYLNQLIATRRASGFEQVCTAASNIAKCLGDQMEACFSTQHLEAVGVPASDVLTYRIMQAALTSECGAGYEAIHKNIDCMINCAERHQSEFVRCAADFERSIKRDPSRVCEYAQTMLRCNTALFDQSCGSELSGAVCNALRAEISVPLPTCKNLTCLSTEDASLIDSTGLLTGGRATFMLDALAENIPPSMARQMQTPAQEDTDDDSDSDDSDDQDNPNDGDVADGERAKCNDKKFGRCVKAYAQQLGLKSFPHDPAEYAKAIQAIVAKYGKLGFKKICTSGRKLAQCLGRQQIGACINVAHLVELGLTKEQATGYIMVARILGYECTKAYKVLYDNFDCIMNVSKRYNDTFTKCAQDFVKKIKKDPKHVCKYVQTLINCDTKPFAQKCSRQVSTTICQIFQVSLKQSLPKCQIKCNRSDDNVEVPAAVLTPARPVQQDEDDAADVLAS